MTGDEKAAAFLAATGVKVEKRYTGHRPHWSGDTEQRAVWQITLRRESSPGMPARVWSFTFGDSLADSWQVSWTWGKFPGWRFVADAPHEVTRAADFHGSLTRAARAGGGRFSSFEFRPAHREPSDFDVLSCLDKGDGQSFADFCYEFGYNTDSRKALATWEAVEEERAQLRRMFTPAERNALAEID